MKIPRKEAEKKRETSCDNIPSFVSLVLRKNKKGLLYLCSCSFLSKLTVSCVCESVLSKNNIAVSCPPHHPHPYACLNDSWQFSMGEGGGGLFLSCTKRFSTDNEHALLLLIVLWVGCSHGHEGAMRDCSNIYPVLLFVITMYMCVCW